ATAPDQLDVLQGRGLALSRLLRYEEAAADFNRVLAGRPDSAEAHFNLGNVQQLLGHDDDALHSYDHAIALKPDYEDAKFNKSLLLLNLGRFEEGWPLFESR